MVRDFTLTKYRQLLEAAISAGYSLIAYEDYVTMGSKYDKILILRHDVDDLPGNSLATARVEKELGARGSYYFRVVKQSFDEKIIRDIKELGHEIGYHYEDMALCRGNAAKAWQHFQEKLNLFKKFYPVKTICMHGSPLSKWDNRLLWQTYSYKELGILAEPYFDTDFEKVFYLTDTGRRWNNTAASVRDKVKSNFNLSFNSTDSVCRHFAQNKMPQTIMLTIHPQRWTDNYYIWSKELIFQNLKNVIKRLIIK